MGNKKSLDQKNGIHMTTESSRYNAGDKIFGNVYLSIFDKFIGGCVILSLTGKEKTKWQI